MSVGWLVGWLVGLSVTHSFDDPHVAPYWPTWPCFFLQHDSRWTLQQYGTVICFLATKVSEKNGSIVRFVIVYIVS